MSDKTNSVITIQMPPREAPPAWRCSGCKNIYSIQVTVCPRCYKELREQALEAHSRASASLKGDPDEPTVPATPASSV